MDVGTLDPHLLHAEAFIHMVVPMVVSEVANGDDDVVALYFFFLFDFLILVSLIVDTEPPSLQVMSFVSALFNPPILMIYVTPLIM